MWLPSGVAKLQKKTVSARASYALGAETNDVVESFIAIAMEDGSSVFAPDLSEEFSIQGGEGAFGQVTVDTAPILLRNGVPLASDDKGAVSWFYSFGPNDEDVCASWESLLTECGTNGVLNVGTYGVGATYITGEASEGLGLVSGSFEVTKKELLPSMVADVPAQAIVQGSQATPAVSVADGKLFLIKASDYAITYGANNVSGKGTGSVTVTATDAGNYFGSVTKTFDIGVSSSPGAGSAKMAGEMLAKTGDALGFGIVSVAALFVGALMVLISARWLSRRRK